MSKTPVKQLQEKLRQLGRQDSSPIEEVGVFKILDPLNQLQMNKEKPPADEQGKATCR